MRRVVGRTALIVACTLVSSTAFGGWLSPCATARLATYWRSQGLDRGPLIYAPPKVTDGHRVRYVGAVRAGGRAYRIYFDRFVNPEDDRETRDIVVMRAGAFLGVYDVSVDPVGVQGSDVLFASRKEDGNRIHFGPKGPPALTWIDGENPDFSTAAYWKQLSHEGPLAPPPRLKTYCRR